MRRTESSAKEAAYRVRVLFRVPEPADKVKLLIGEGLVQVTVEMPAVLLDELMLLYKLDGVEINLSPMVPR